MQNDEILFVEHDAPRTENTSKPHCSDCLELTANGQCCGCKEMTAKPHCSDCEG